MDSVHNPNNLNTIANHQQTNLNPTKLTITAINVNSLVTNQKRYDVLELAQRTNSDIILVTETKLNARHQFNPAKFKLIRTDRPSSTAGGGTAILIKRNIEHEHIRYPTSQANKLLEYTIIRIPINNASLYLIAIYVTNGGSSPIFIKELEELLQGINAHSDNSFYLIAGDPNIKSKQFGNNIANQIGRVFDK